MRKIREISPLAGAVEHALHLSWKAVVEPATTNIDNLSNIYLLMVPNMAQLTNIYIYI